MSNLIKKLRDWANSPFSGGELMAEAADEIEQLRVEQAQYEEEIERLNNICEYARNEIKDQRAEIERLRAEHGDMNVHCVRLEKQNEKLQAVVDELAEWEPVGEAGDSIEMKAFAIAALEDEDE